MTAAAELWQIWVDTGGTFTDCLARDPGGALRRVKVLSSGSLRATVVERRGKRQLALAGLDELRPGALQGWRLTRLAGDERLSTVAWDGSAVELAAAAPRSFARGTLCELVSPEEAPLLACRLITGTAPDAPLPPLRLRLATTLGTNALLERRGAPTGLFLTRGFGDLVEIGTQQRPDLFALAIEKPAPLYATTVEVEERHSASGEVLAELDEAALAVAARRVREAGVTSAAVALLHSFRYPEVERRVAKLLREHGFAHVSASAELAPALGYLARAETALVDAYLAPILEGYLGRIAHALRRGDPASEATKSTPLLVMTSAGGLSAASRFRAHEGLLSGPAAGVVGAAEAARRSGFERVLTFDMGGTSTDVARWDGELPWVFEHRVGEARLLAPAVAVETVAAGGGSICSFDGHRLRVGPESGGARPGPACYGAGGPLCLTDVNLLLGRVDASRFEIPLDVAAAGRACTALEASLTAAGESMPRERLLAGLLRIADERMAEAIREISVRRGYDPAGYALLAFGGAGGQHACAVAELLGIGTVMVPADASLLSALGLGVARLERVTSRQVLRPLAEVGEALPGWLAELGEAASAEVRAQGAGADEVTVERRLVELRFVGQESVVEVTWEEGRSVAEEFAARYRDLFGYLPETRPVEVVALRAAAAARPALEAVPPRPEPREARPALRRRVWLGGRWRRVPVHNRERLPPGTVIDGPALVLERHSATLVDRDWELSVDGAAALVLRRAARAPATTRRAVESAQ
ncbi:MAG TPA: hydantoinase/oxoprolinase family protein [Thermoanaerobaculia bacterium]|nr:hydantoinase/oxoprolinase family protein [Thermoanaerobaculia bacterium]